ncbi:MULTISPECIES: hypothetical protein [Psychromonas]|uniref:hypothetical protein n=1 Tax=Psychromonas TaxID=67572 RepID=UPI002FD3F8C0
MRQISLVTLLKKHQTTSIEQQTNTSPIVSIDNTEAYFIRLMAHQRNQITGLQNNNRVAITKV